MSGILDDNYKTWVIEQLMKEHPGHGCNKGWSKYVGGMTDTGGWFAELMRSAPISELEYLLRQIQKSNKEWLIKFTEYESSTEAEQWRRYMKQKDDGERQRYKYIEEKYGNHFFGIKERNKGLL